MEYFKLVRQAYQATFAHKRMWWLGMAILAGSSLSGQIFSNGFQIAADSADTEQFSDAMSDLFNSASFEQWWADSWWLLLVALGLLLILWVVAYFVHLVAQSGLYYGANQARLGKPVQFGEMCSVGLKTLGRYFGFYILFGLAHFLAVMTFLLSCLMLGASIIGLVIAIPLFLLTILFSWAIAMVVELFFIYCLQGITLHHYSSLETFTYAWKKLRSHFFENVLAALLIFLLQMIIGLGKFLLYLILITPFAILCYVAYTSEAWMMLLLTVIIGSVVFLAIWLIVKGMVQSFYAHLWHRIYASFDHELAGIAQR